MTQAQLRSIAQGLGVRTRSRMRKPELLGAIRDRQRELNVFPKERPGTSGESLSPALAELLNIITVYQGESIAPPEEQPAIPGGPLLPTMADLTPRQMPTTFASFVNAYALDHLRALSGEFYHLYERLAVALLEGGIIRAIDQRFGELPTGHQLDTVVYYVLSLGPTTIGRFLAAPLEMFEDDPLFRAATDRREFFGTLDGRGVGALRCLWGLIDARVGNPFADLLELALPADGMLDYASDLAVFRPNSIPPRWQRVVLAVRRARAEAQMIED